MTLWEKKTLLQCWLFSSTRLGRVNYSVLLALIIIIIIVIIIPFISIAQIQQFSFQMRFTILEEIKSTLLKSLFLQSLFTNQIKSNVGF